MHAAGYLTAACVTVAELIQFPLGRQFAWTVALLAAFVVVLAATMRGAHLVDSCRFIAAALGASATGVAIMAVGPSATLRAVLFFVLCTIADMRLPAWAAFAWMLGSIAAFLVCLLLRGQRERLPTILSFGVGFFAIAASFRRSLQARAESQQLLGELAGAQGRLRDMAVNVSLLNAWGSAETEAGLSPLLWKIDQDVSLFL